MMTDEQLEELEINGPLLVRTRIAGRLFVEVMVNAPAPAYYWCGDGITWERVTEEEGQRRVAEAQHL